VTPEITWTLEWRRAELPAMGGHGNARGLATLQSVLASGGANGVRLMSDKGRERVLEQQSEGPDLVFGVPCRWAMGFALEMAMFPGTPQGARAAFGPAMEVRSPSSISTRGWRPATCRIAG
jgi:hypothetical protein